VATEGAGEGSQSEEEVAVVSPTGFPPRPTRPQGSKAAKGDVVAQKKREKILQSQARATETMAEASLRKANALQDQCAMLVFTMPLEDAMSEEAKKYFTLRRQEEIARLERRMQAERRRAEVEEIEHAKLVNGSNPETPPARRRAHPAPVVPTNNPAATSPPSPNMPDAAVATAGSEPREVPVFAGTHGFFFLLIAEGFRVFQGLGWVVARFRLFFG